jgi:hypothetical protein
MGAWSAGPADAIPARGKPVGRATDRGTGPPPFRDVHLDDVAARNETHIRTRDHTAAGSGTADGQPTELERGLEPLTCRLRGRSGLCRYMTADAE